MASSRLPACVGFLAALQRGLRLLFVRLDVVGGGARQVRCSRQYQRHENIAQGQIIGMEMLWN